MLRISDISFQNTAIFFENAIDIAEYYGFVHETSAKPPDVPDEPQLSAPPKRRRINARDISLTRKDERSLLSVVNTCSNRGIGTTNAPSFIWRKGPTIRADGNRSTSLELHILGVPTPVAEALLLTITSAIAKEAGIVSFTTYLNSIGTEESSMRLLRDVSNYLRKHAGDVPGTLRPSILRDPLGALAQLAEKNSSLLERAPASLEYLNEDERKHFWDLLEYLETANVYYELNHRVLGSRDCWAHTLFDVYYTNTDEKHVPFARGGRYDTLIKKAMGEESAGAFVAISCEMKGRTSFNHRRSQKQATTYFAHLGIEARRKSMALLEALRTAHIRVHQSLAHEYIADQMQVAKGLNVSHMIIMGHKEASEGTVLVRDTRTNAQEPVPVDILPGYLKRRKIGTH